MDKKVKKKWVKALRSGEYEQTQGQLHKNEDNYLAPKGYLDPKGFCCLGVLCDLEYDGYWVVQEDDLGYVDEVLIPAKGGRCGGAGSTTILPDKFRRKLGITPNQHNHLAELNDDGVTFEVIASWIEENL